MAKEIAVYVGENGSTASIYDIGKVVVYRRTCGEWHVLRECGFSLDRTKGLNGLRSSMATILEFLEECKIFVAYMVAGLPYFELEKAEVSIWEFEGKPSRFLDYILDQEELAEQEASGRSDVQWGPVEISDGNYYISLREIQANNMGVTSKQALLPFLKDGRFHTLEVLCDHIPPWLEMELLNGGLTAKTEKAGQAGIRVFISRKECCIG